MSTDRAEPRPGASGTPPLPHTAILVLVPTYNERDNLPALAEAVLRQPGTRLLVIDDGSPDGTGAVADALARDLSPRLTVLHRTGPRGLGRSYLDGFRAALEAPDVGVVCQMDADWSHDPAHLPALVAALGDADLVVGSRYVPGGRVENWPARRKALSACANQYIRAITGLAVHDCTSGYRCWRRDALARLPIDRISSEGYAFLVEVLFLAARAGLRIAESPITFVERRAGVSKLDARVLAESILLPWRLRRQPRPAPSPAHASSEYNSRGSNER
ncbi:MAG: polyprenol monophosphomannose synthase [Vicinamibacterales bacterium]